MLGDVLQARFYWDCRDKEAAFDRLQAVLAGGEGRRAFYWTPLEAEHQAGLLFETAVANILLSEDVLTVPFDVAFARLWEALPLQYLILVLFQRPLDREGDAQIVRLLSTAATQGLVSVEAEDYDLSGKVVLDRDAYPELVEILGGDAFVDSVRQAAADDAWGRNIAPNAALVLDLFFYSVFHREPSTQGEMILGRLERIADAHDAFLSAFSAHLAAELPDWASHARIVSVGMRINLSVDAMVCLREFADALASRVFEPFVRRYFPFNE